LQCKYQTNNKSGNTHQEKRPVTHVVTLSDKLFPLERLVKTFSKKTPGEIRQFAYFLQYGGNGFKYVVEKGHRFLLEHVLYVVPKLRLFAEI